jgi:hypothetical protein
MNFVLYFLLLVAGGTAYYAYNWEQQTATGFEIQEETWSGELEKREEANKKLADAAAEVTRQEQDARNEAAQLTTDLANAQKAAQAVAGPAPLPPPTAPATSNALGTITTMVGETYHNAQLLKVEPNDIVIGSAEGITQIPYRFLPANLQARFGYDPRKPESLGPDQIEELEKIRRANSPDGQ